MVARGDSMFGWYDSYSYRLWNLANMWNTCHYPALTNGTTAISAVPVLIKDDEDTTSSSATTAASVAAVAATSPNPDYCLKCPQCGKSCGGSFHALKEHLALAHPDLGTPDHHSTGLSPPLGTGALSPTGLLGNGPGGPYGCSQCTSSFPNKDQLEKHELLHSPNSQVSCKICNKTFANVYRLQRHMISHDESAILRKFKCTECDKAFKFKHHLKEHIRIHSGEKPFECRNCGKRFSHSGSYSSHLSSKKCLVINLKLGRARTPAATNTLVMENKPPQGQRGPKRASPNNSNSLNNNITTTNHNNAYLSILPKYPEAAAAAFLQNTLATNGAMHPFYMSPSTISPYPMPTLEHILDQLKQNASPLHRPSMPEPAHTPTIDKLEEIKRIPIRQDAVDSLQPPQQQLNKSRSSSCNDLVMDEQSDQEEKMIMKHEKTNGDLQAVKMILETVNATVTQQLLQANMHKFQDHLSESRSSARSVHSPMITESVCRICKRIFNSHEALEDHECEMNEIQSEGLAAKLEDAVATSKHEADHQINGIPGGNTSSVEEDQEMDKRDDYDIDSESVTTTDQLTEDGRKVRVRSLISDEQLKILKDNYLLNQRPKREELLKIAEQIGFPVRVVQVWFQNTRARDRREGRIIQVPYTAPTNHQAPPQHPQQQIVRFPITPQYLHSTQKLYNVPIKTASSSEEEFVCEQPLDLSTRNKDAHSHDSSPASSPRRSASVHHHSDSGDDVMNLSSHKSSSSRSPTPLTKYHNHYHQVSNSSSSDTAQRTPSPMDFHNGRLAQILAQQQPKLAASMGLVPMEHLMQFSAASDFPSISQLISSRMSANLSPGSSEDKRSIIGGDGDSQDDDTTSMNGSKRRKMSGSVGPNSLMLKASLGSPALLPGSQEMETEGQFTCDQCDKAFNKQSSLARHKYEHSGQRPHKCNECTKAFKHKHHLTEHKRLHSGEKPFQCPKCQKRFSHSGSYSQHINHRYSYCKPYRE